MSAQSLSPRALYEEVAELLRQRIFKRELEPGSWIDELKIAQDYGISRTPLREALKVLAAEGLVELLPNRGAIAVELSEADVLNTFDKSVGKKGIYSNVSGGSTAGSGAVVLSFKTTGNATRIDYVGVEKQVRK